jgi:hypothetical protein
MMAGPHPSDIELLEYVEGELSDEAAASVREHLASCETCAQEAAAVGSSRAVLRASPLLELPEERLHALIEDLPPQEVSASERRRFVLSRTRLLAVLTPAAVAVVAVVAVVLVTRDGSDANQAQPEAIAAQTTAQAEAATPTAPATIEEEPVEAAPAETTVEAPAETTAEAPGETLPPNAGGANETLDQARQPAFQVDGPAREVVGILREAGLEAKAVEGSVEVRGATHAELEQALEGRQSGDVDVFLVP